MDKIKLFTLHSIKGLEASVVFIAGVNDGILPYSTEMLSVERKLLYVKKFYFHILHKPLIAYGGSDIHTGSEADLNTIVLPFLPHYLSFSLPYQKIGNLLSKGKNILLPHHHKEMCNQVSTW